MSRITSNTWVPTGNDFVIDGLWGRLGVQEKFGETYISGATNGLAVKNAGDKVFLYAGSVNGGIHLRIYAKATDSWGDSWEWISKPGSGYFGSQAIGALSISEDGKYLAVGQGNPSNGGLVAAQSQGLQIGQIKDNGTIEWLPVEKTESSKLQGKNIRSLAWDGARLLATSWNDNAGASIIATTSADGIGFADVTPNNAIPYLSKGGDYIVESKELAIAIAGRGEQLNELTGDNYQALIEEIASKGNLINRVAVHDQLVDGELIVFAGAFRYKENEFISAIARLRIDPVTRELLDYSIFEVNKGDIGTNQAGNLQLYGNFSFAVDPHDPTANSIIVGGNGFWEATLRTPTVAGGLVRVDFSGNVPIISETLYGPKIDTTKDELVIPFSPGQPHADSRTIVFYDSATGPRLIQSDDGGIWELQLDGFAQGSKPASGAWWESLTTKGLNTLEMNVGTWNAATNSIAAAYQDNAASLGYFGDDHATNFWVADGTIALFDDGANQGEYTGYLGNYGYITDGTLAAQTYNNEGFITGRKDAFFLLQRADGVAPIPWSWAQAEQSAQQKYLGESGEEFIFNVPVQSNAYQQGIALAGFANIYEQISSSFTTPQSSLILRPLLESDLESSFFYGTAIDYQGTPVTFLNQSLYVAGFVKNDGTIIYGREANNDPNSFNLEPKVKFTQDQKVNIVDIAHASTSEGDVIYWIQGGKNIALGGADTESVQTLSIRDADGEISLYSLNEISDTNDPYGYQTLVYVPAKGDRTARLVIGGLNGPYFIELNDQGMPQNPNLEFIKMPWQGLPNDRSPGSYIRSMEYDPHDDLLYAATQGQGGFVYSFTGELGERPQSDELLHISDITLAQNSKAALDKRGNQQNSTITIQLNSELQAKDSDTEIEIILHDADQWREWMELVSPYNINLSVAGISKDTAAGATALQYLNILDPLGLEYRSGREENGDIIMPFTFPAGVSLYNLIINQKEFAYPQDTVSLNFSVKTIDGANKQSARLELVPESASTRAVFNGSSLAFEGDYFENDNLPLELTDQLFKDLIPEKEYQTKGSTIANTYTITPSIRGLNAILPTSSKNHATRTTLPIDTYSILRASNSLNSVAEPGRSLFASKANVFNPEVLTTNPEELKVKFEQLITYDSTSGFGSRFYDLSGDGYADYISISANASQSEFSKDVALGFGSVVIQPEFISVDGQQVMLVDGVKEVQAYPFNIRVNASVDLDERPASTSSIGYIIFNPGENLIDFSNTLFKERAKTLITILGETVDLSAVPQNSNFLTEILINNGQRVMYFEVEGGSLDQLTGVDDPRLSWFETEVMPDQNGKTLALSNANQTALTVNITPGVQGINPLIADLQNQAPILDLTAFATDQTITGTLAYGREAALDSRLGWYVISRADGAITAANGDTLLPGDVSYIQEALRADNLIDPLAGIETNDGEISSKDFSITGGRLLAPYAKVSNGETYFAFAAANSDGLEHFYSLGTNKIGFEDLKGGGDRDFQDLVQMFDFSILNEPAPMVISGKQTITDKSLIGTEDYPKGPTGDHFPIYWPGTRTSKIVVNDQPGVIKDVAVAFALTGDSTQDAERIFVTLISPSGVRIPIAGTTIDPTYLSYGDISAYADILGIGGNTGSPEEFGLSLKSGQSKGYLYGETEESITDYSIDNSIKNKITQEKSSLSLASLKALSGAQPNGEWQLEVKNSSDVPIQLNSWQLFLKSEEKSVSTDGNGAYSFESISPSSITGPVTPWVSLPSDRSLNSPTGKLNANIRLGEDSPQISFGLSTQGSTAAGTNPNNDNWERFDLTSLISPNTLLPKTTLNQAVTSLEADSARAKYGVNGQGIKIGLLSSSWNQLGGEAWDYKTGVLDPNRVTITRSEQNAPGHSNEGNDEGRAMAQVIHSIAPGADIDFYSYDDSVFPDMIDDAWKKDKNDPERNEIIRKAFEVYEGQLAVWEQSLISLAENGARIIVDDLDDAEPWFEDGRMTKAINKVINDYGITYFAAAGNSSDSSYQASFNAKGLDDVIKEDRFKDLPVQLQDELKAGHELHLFEGTEGTTYLQSIKGALQGITLQWNSKWGENNKSLKVMIFDENDVYQAEGLLDPQKKYPWTWFDTNFKTTYKIAVIHNGTSSETRPGVFKWIAGNSLDVQISKDSDLGFHSSTVIGHTAGNLSANVGSIQYWSTPAYRADTSELSQYSSWGVTPIYFDSEGNFLSEPEIRQNPAFVVPQKGDTSFFSQGYDVLHDSDGNSFQNFEGTSAAAPNAAAVAALMLQLNPTLTPSQIIDILKETATPVQTYDHTTTDKNGFNRASGYGLINAMDALDHIAQLKLSGTVYEDANADGQQSDGERGLEGIQVFLDSNGNGRFDQNNTWQSFLATASGGESSSAATKPTLVADKITGLAIDSRYETVLHGSGSLNSNSPFSDRSLLISSITSSSDHDVITERGKDLILNGDLLLHFDGDSRTTPGSYSILKANSISGSFDNILIEGLSDDLYFGIGIEGGDNIQVTVSEDYFVGSTQAGSLF